MTLSRRMAAPFLAVLLVLALLPAPALAGRERSNADGGLNGIYRATVLNRTQDTRMENLEVEVEDKFVMLRFPAGVKKMRIDQIYDRAYQLEITARDPDNGDLWIVQIET